MSILSSAASFLHVLLLCTTLPATVMVLYQQVVPPPYHDGVANINEGAIYLAQTTHNVNPGYLSQVDVALARYSYPYAPWVCSIVAVNGSGTPTSTVLASELIPAASISTHQSDDTPLVQVSFRSPPFLTQNTAFAIRINIQGGTGNGVGGDGSWRGKFYADVYPGYQYYASNNGSTYTPNGGDLFFRTYITAPEPASPLVLSVAFVLILSRRQK